MPTYRLELGSATASEQVGCKGSHVCHPSRAACRIGCGPPVHHAAVHAPCNLACPFTRLPTPLLRAPARCRLCSDGGRPGAGNGTAVLATGTTARGHLPCRPAANHAAPGRSAPRVAPAVGCRQRLLEQRILHFFNALSNLHGMPQLIVGGVPYLERVCVCACV